MTSIRRRLLVTLLAGVAGVAALATFATWIETRREIGELFDLQLKQLAYSTRIDDLIRGRQPGLAPPDARRAPGVAEIVTQIWDRNGVLVYFSQPGTGLPVPAQEGYTNVLQDGREWRVYTHVEGTHALQVAHAMDERRELVAQSALRTLVPLLLLIPFLGVLIWIAVGRGMKPLDAMSRAVAKRRPDAMAPIAETGLPIELRPLAGSLNALLARLDGALTAQRRFTADAAHELRTPLAALTLQVELAERSSDPAARATALADLKAGVGRATRLVEQLLAMARLEPEAFAQARVPVDLAALARDAIVAREPLAASRRIDLGLAEANGDAVLGDAASLSMLIGNLLDNALRHTPEGGKIDVAVTNHDGQPRFTVSDNGPGIPAAERERVFDRFYRGASAIAQSGSGLGLSIVKRIAEAHGATVTLEDAISGAAGDPARDGAAGRGLCVTVSFPALSVV